MKKETKEKLKEWYGYDVESENPLKLVVEDEKEIVLVGLTADLMVKQLETEIYEQEHEDDDFDLSKYEDDDMLLVKANVNYADEFDMEDFTTMTVETYKELVELLKNHDDEIEWYFGSNEELSFNNGQDLLDCFEVVKISEEEDEVLDKLFGGSFGEAGVFDNCWDLESDEDEDEDEDFDDEDEEPTSMLDKSDIRKIEKLKVFGWTITENIGEYKFWFEHSNGEKSYGDFDMILYLTEYYKK